MTNFGGKKPSAEGKWECCISNNKGRVAQIIRVKTPSGMGQNAHLSILSIKHWASCPTRVSIAKFYNKFLNVHINETRVCLTIANTLCHKHAITEEKDSNRKRTVR